MKKFAALAQAGLFAAGCLAVSGAAQAARPELPMFGVHAYLGTKALKEDDWAPAEDQFAYGGSFDFQPHGWPIGFTAGYLGGQGKGDLPGNNGEFKSTTSEYRLGIKGTWQTGRIGRAFAGAGVSFAHAKGEASAGGSLDGDGTGGWIGGGYLFELGSHFDLGLEASYSFVKADLSGNGASLEVEAGGASVGAVGGFRW